MRISTPFNRNNSSKSLSSVIETLPVSSLQFERALQPFLWCQGGKLLPVCLRREGVRGKNANATLHVREYTSGYRRASCCSRQLFKH